METPPSPDRCIACTICLVACPVSAATLEYPGPRFVGPAYERFRLLGLAEENTLHYCSNCKNCDIACPHGVPVSTLLMRARGAQTKQNRPALRDWLLAHGSTLAAWTKLFPKSLCNAVMLHPLARRILSAFGIAPQAPLPPFAAQNLRSWLRKKSSAPANRKIAFFPGCYTDIYEPESGQDIIWLLQKAGYEVSIPKGFVCCGLPMVANGFWEHARKNAAINLAILAQCKNDNIQVLTGCPSCALMFNTDIPEYFPELAATPDVWQVTDAQHFLLDCLNKGELLPPHTAPPYTVIYHAPCHLRAQGQGLSGLELLRALPGCTATNADAGCCGISGSYGFKKDKYPISMQVGEALFKVLRESPANTAASDCGTCRLQMRHGTGRTILHPASIMRKALESA